MEFKNILKNPPTKSFSDFCQMFVISKKKDRPLGKKSIGVDLEICGNL
jgi:hypothetical protein